MHAMLIVGYMDREQVFIVRNSWGENWGVGGCSSSATWIGSKSSSCATRGERTGVSAGTAM
eukprot:CAMPEP_0113267530 /NCGR_PEP_ID=MMETSP0008_2-20120614/20656_1 /TAXON_ID=97485 /ORGANISM="Prymnesium parvum" /LENGTH=60 /DNA_ID=CAMNT_0000116565 /DNA_START=1 /DNA_END=180 /DNA_ORIENTATION=- /assembly_acc=CAM_ASM_000153